MRKTRSVLIVLIVCVGFLQLIKPQQPERTPVDNLTGVPTEVNSIIRNSCFNCHSTETHLEWYDRFTPVNFFVYDHIRKGRNALDFSNWDSLAPAQQNATLYYSLNKILAGEMPLPSYTAVHPKAKLSKNDIMILKDFLTTRMPPKKIDSLQASTVNQQFSDFIKGELSLSKQSVKPSPNGIEYIAGYRNWKVISISDRFDNGTMRIIYGNDIAVKAIQSQKTNPWPTGAILAKTAWKQQANQDGSISTGEFVQVEFMIKDAKKYAHSAGWGWARWRGKELTPYGGKAIFTTECISCHKPLKENDYVFTKPLSLRDYSKKIRSK